MKKIIALLLFWQTLNIQSAQKQIEIKEQEEIQVVDALERLIPSESNNQTEYVKISVSFFKQEALIYCYCSCFPLWACNPTRYLDLCVKIEAPKKCHCAELKKYFFSLFDELELIPKKFEYVLKFSQFKIKHKRFYRIDDQDIIDFSHEDERIVMGYIVLNDDDK